MNISDSWTIYTIKIKIPIFKQIFILEN